MTNAIVPGSLSAVAQATGRNLAESFLSCSILILLDESGSMSTPDTPSGKTRRQAARDEVIRLQATLPGKIGLFVFSSTVVFCPTGVPLTLDAGTDLHRALEYLKPADGCGLKIIIISDGVPSQIDRCLALARTFENRIDTIFIGPEDDNEGGRAFLQQLADATGGHYAAGSAETIQEQVLLLVDKNREK